MRKIKKAALFAAMAMAFTGASLLPTTIRASAGSSRSNVASEASIVDGRINTGDFMVSGGVRGEGNAIVFDKDCAASSKVLGKTKINNLGSYGVQNLLEGSLSVQLNSLVKDEGTFSICFGLQSLSAKRESKGVVELRFYEDNGINFVVYEHYGEGLYNTLLASKQYDDMQAGGKADMNLLVTSDGLFTLTINGVNLFEKTLYEGGDGYFAIFSEGVNEVSVSDLALFGYSYDVPQNVNYTETFDNNAYNANMFYTMSNVAPLSPSYLTVEDNALKFSNTAGAHITTRYTYSNFELQFDVVDLQRTAVLDENGNIVKLISNWFSIAFGVDTVNQLPESTNVLATSLQVEGMPSDSRTDQTVPYEMPRLILWDKGKAQDIKAMSYNIWNAEHFDGKVVNVKFSMKDGLVQLWMKTAEDESWGEPQFAYNLGYTPSGYVRIFTWGQNSVTANGLKYNSIANFTIDNLSIKNTDYEGVRQLYSSIEYKSNYIPSTPDFDYTTKTEDGDLLINRIEEVNVEEEKGCGSVLSCSMLMPLLTAGAIAVARKGGKKDE